MWPRNIFVDYYKCTPEEAGYSEVSYNVPNGVTLQGIRLPWDEANPPPRGVVKIAKDFKIQVCSPPMLAPSFPAERLV